MDNTLINSQPNQKTKKSLSKHYLGIDPASEGAAILLDENGKVVLSFLWKKRRRKKQVIFDLRLFNLSTQKIIMYQASRFSQIGSFISKMVSQITDNIELGCEDSYFRPNPKATITISRLSGLIVSPIECEFDVDCKWTRAADWRHKVLGLNPFTKREQAKNASLKKMPNLIPNLSSVLHKLGYLDHITDASGVAYLMKKQSNP